MALKPGSIVEGYEIIETIGKGAMSTVYLGRKNNNAIYAIKELKSKFSSPEEEKILINAFHREANLLFSVEHPGVPRFYKSFKYNGKSYIVMEYIKGISLEDIIKGSTLPLDEQKALHLGIQICEILCCLHNLSPEPVIYRDLKPSNIIITDGDTVRLIDFGVARRYDPAKDCDTVRLGTPGYAAPEQCRKKGQSIPQSDMYALGVVLHQLLTLYDPSVTPFKLPALGKLNQKVSEQLEYLINKAINLDSRDRYIDTGLFREELVEYYEENFGSFISPYRESLPYNKEKNSLLLGSSSQVEITGWKAFFLKLVNFFWEPIELVHAIIAFVRELIVLLLHMRIDKKIAMVWIVIIVWIGFIKCLNWPYIDFIFKVIHQVFTLILIPLLYLIITYIWK
ncbi:MAG: serine/threonine-protein kinase [Candidatus Eremiobacterota bacterium]